MLTQKNASKYRVIQTTSLTSRAAANSPSLLLSISLNLKLFHQIISLEKLFLFTLHVQIL